MRKILVPFALGFIRIASAADRPLPVELVGEWRSSISRPSYQALYLSSEGTVWFVAVGDGQKSHGGKGAATYDSLLRTVSLTLPGNSNVYRFRYNPETKGLLDLTGPASTVYRKVSGKVTE